MPIGKYLGDLVDGRDTASVHTYIYIRNKIFLVCSPLHGN